MEEAQQPVDIGIVVREAVAEYARAEQTKSEPAYKAELLEERKRREQLERRVNELVEENQRTRKTAEEADRNSTVRAELQRLGVAKVELAFKAVKDEIVRTEDGRLIGRSEEGEFNMKDYLAKFVNDNPEFLPARITGGSGVSAAQKAGSGHEPFDMDKIRPGMSPEDKDRVRREIARVAGQALSR